MQDRKIPKDYLLSFFGHIFAYTSALTKKFVLQPTNLYPLKISNRVEKVPKDI